MAKKRSETAVKKEEVMQQALAGLATGKWKTPYAAAHALNIPSRNLYNRVKEDGKSRSEARVAQQSLTVAEERELVKWIRGLTMSGTPAQHSIIKEMAETIRNKRVAYVNDSTIEHVSYPPLGDRWTQRFIRRHPDLKSVVGKRIEASRINCSTEEAFNRWFDAFKEVKDEFKIKDANIYNMDETGSALGTVNATRVIIDKSVGSEYQKEPGRQEWITVIECICADGTTIAPMVIFKGESLNARDVVEGAEGWKFAFNSKGWTSNAHGLSWFHRCFEPDTRDKANGGYRLLICDGHDSHITAAVVELCINNKIILMVLPPHTSHLLQPLDVAIFAPVKQYLATQNKKFINCGIARQQRPEWLLAYAKARESAITKRNIYSAFRGAGLIPFYPSKAIDRLPKPLTPPLQPQTPEPRSILESTLLTSSPPNVNDLQNVNAELIRRIKPKKPLDTPECKYIPRLTKSVEHLCARLSIAEDKIAFMETVIGARKKRTSGKRVMLKDQIVYTKPEVLKTLKDLERATKKQKKKRSIRAHKKGKVASPEVELTLEDTDDPSDDESKEDNREIMSEIEVEML